MAPLMEAGIRDFDLNLWVGIFAPRATPNETIARLNRDINHRSLPIRACATTWLMWAPI
jgi:hypothetical protein